MNEASNFEVVHLATHAQFSYNAEHTFLLTCDGRINVKDLQEFLQPRGEGNAKRDEIVAPRATALFVQSRSDLRY